ncbi:MAG TPA: ABC transporter ATP-binding protein [Anaerovoracaceae bacterium]|nr:ABC transporter ATP-binding protein [Anaerovoracaceae bacterium]
MLKLSNINSFYGEVQVLKDLSLQVNQGEIVTLIGANAAGKSTLISCISRTVRSFAGEIEFEGNRIDQLRPDQVVELGLVQVPEGRLLFPKLTVRENLELGAYSKRSRNSRKDRLEYVYGLLPRMKERANQLAGSLSGGEAQMCAIGRGLMAQPKLLMFDEPSLGLAPIVVKEIMGLIKNIRKEGMTILLVEQNVRQSLKLADRAYVIENGRIIMEGQGRELLDSSEVKKAYLGI